MPVILEGKWNEQEMQSQGFYKAEIQKLLAGERTKLKSVILLALDENNRMTLQRRKSSIVFKNVEVNRK